MRLNILVLALFSSAVSAQASSIDVVVTGKDAPRSIEKISCPSCVAKPKKVVQSVVELAPGTQRVEIREVGGVKKIYRTEAWLGGSPVVMVSKALPDEMPVLAEGQPDAENIAAAPATIADQPAVSADANTIDEKSTTAAVTADMGATVKADVTPKAQTFDPSKLELRLN